MNMHRELITADLRTTSRVVAEKFGKHHKNVLRDIENVMKDAGEAFNRLNFEPVSYLDAKGEERPMYEMTRDGFTLLAFGFTGKAAMEWKIRFIEAFNLMEAEIAGPKRRDGLEIPPYEEPLSTQEWLSLIRETRLANGPSAAQRVYAQSPFASYLHSGNEPSNEEVPCTPMTEEEIEQIGFAITFPEVEVLRIISETSRQRRYKTAQELVHLTGYGPEEMQEYIDRMCAFDVIKRNEFRKRTFVVTGLGEGILWRVENRRKEKAG